MTSKVVLAAAALLGAVALLLAPAASAQEGGGPPPSAGTKIAEGLQGTIGAAVGPDGALYVAEAGTGGDTELTPPPEFPADEPVPTFGLTGQVTRIDPETGELTVVASGIGSIGGPEGAGGAVDVAFMGDDMYVLTTGSADAFGVDEWPNGIYRAEGDTIQLVANLSEFANENPVEFPDAGPGGNPFALDVRGNEFIVTDGNYNRILRVTLTGNISVLHAFDNVVPTGIEAGGSGPLLMTQFSSFPHTADKSIIVSVAIPTGNVATIAGGFAQLIDVENGPGGTYALQFGSTDTSPEGDPFSGKILSLEGGELSPLVTGFMLPTSLDFSGDTAYVTTLLGEVWQIENFSAVQPPAPQPTAAPTSPAATPTAGTGVTPPDTGTGPDDGPGAGVLLVAMLLGAAGLVAGASALAARRV